MLALLNEFYMIFKCEFFLKLINNYEHYSIVCEPVKTLFEISFSVMLLNAIFISFYMKFWSALCAMI